ncbi:MAG TPA: ABC transporter ATP-binding protein [Candidatus Limnocylindria bacterium]|nr:ABC transporter ATP-binding protein [Candidatus Limnocylindria bacterium]
MSAGGDAAAIACRGLTKRYGTVTALDGLDLDVPAGSVFGFLGPNGAGKTTTLRILTSLARATAGGATVGGLTVGDGAPNRAGLIGYLDQDPRFYGWMHGRELLTMMGRLYGMAGDALERRVDEVLDAVGLAEAADRRIGGYSGGMRQRLGLGQAILNRPPILLLDEPVSALDPEGRRDMLGTIRALGGSSTVLFSTHILNDVERVCDRVAILDRGRLVTESAVDALLARYAADVYLVEPEGATPERLQRVATALGEVDGVARADPTNGRVRVMVRDANFVNHRLLGAMATLDIPIASFERQRPTLEDVFLQLVGRNRGEAA